MLNPIEYEMLAKIQHAALLKEAAQARTARLARSDAPRPATRGWSIILSLAVLAVGLVLFTGILW